MTEPILPHKSCPQCRQAKPLSDFGKNRSQPDGHSPWCRVCANAKRRAYYHGNLEANKNKQRAYRAANKEKFRAYDLTHRQQPYVKALKRQRRLRLRLQALEAYGQVCACCGESQYEFLAIDHIDGNGNAHRREAFKGSGGTVFYEWLARNNYPSGFQVLCHNCNLAKGFYGECPHVKLRMNLLKIA